MKPNTFLIPLLILLFLSYPDTGGPQVKSNESGPFKKARMRMVERDLKGRDITDGSVLKVMGRVKRHLFVDPDLRKKAYADHPLPIGEGQTISQPYIVALMTQILDLKKGEKVLEIGTGSGYQAAVLAELDAQVFSLEIRKGLADMARRRLKDLGYKRVKVKEGDGYYGWEEHAPFDAVIITCAVNHIPRPLLRQLKDGGRLLLPLGGTLFYQTLTLVTKKGDDFSSRVISDVRFVPMIGEALSKKP